MIQKRKLIPFLFLLIFIPFIFAENTANNSRGGGGDSIIILKDNNSSISQNDGGSLININGREFYLFNGNKIEKFIEDYLVNFSYQKIEIAILSERENVSEDAIFQELGSDFELTGKENLTYNGNEKTSLIGYTDNKTLRNIEQSDLNLTAFLITQGKSVNTKKVNNSYIVPKIEIKHNPIFYLLIITIIILLILTVIYLTKRRRKNAKK